MITAVATVMLNYEMMIVPLYQYHHWRVCKNPFRVFCHLTNIIYSPFLSSFLLQHPFPTHPHEPHDENTYTYLDSPLKKPSVPSGRLRKSNVRIVPYHIGAVYEQIIPSSGMRNVDTGDVPSLVFKARWVVNWLMCVQETCTGLGCSRRDGDVLFASIPFGMEQKHTTHNSIDWIDLHHLTQSK